METSVAATSSPSPVGVETSATISSASPSPTPSSTNSSSTGPNSNAAASAGVSSSTPSTATTTTNNNSTASSSSQAQFAKDMDTSSPVNFLDDPPVNLNLFVNYLPQEVNDEALRAMFSQYGEIESCKVMIDLATGQSRCFGFVKFKNAKEAQTAVQALNGYKYGTKTLVVKYANATNTTALGTPSSNVYVKGIPLVMSNEQLQQLFSPYGHIADCKILLDPQTQLSRGMGFIRYATQQEAENAINALNGQALPGTVKPIIVKFADTEEERHQRRAKQQKKRTQGSRFAPYASPVVPDTNPRAGGYGAYPAAYGHGHHHHPYAATPSYPAAGHMVPGQPHVPHMGQEANLFVYHLPSDADDALLYRLFSPYGAIDNVKVIRDHSTGACKGYGFVKMINIADAWNAIHGLSIYKVGDKFLQVTFKRGT